MLLRISIGLLVGFFVLVCLRFVPTVSSRTVQLEYELGRQFVQHHLVQLDSRNIAQQVRQTGRMSIAAADLSFDLELVPHDLRAAGYRAEEFAAGGVAHPIDVGPVHTYKGRARSSQGGVQFPQLGEARFTIDDQGVKGLIITPTEHYFVEPAQKFSKAAYASDYVIYRESDVVTSATSSCGVTLSEQVNQRLETVQRENPEAISQSHDESGESSTPIPTVNDQVDLSTPVKSKSSLLNIGIPDKDLKRQPLTIFKKDGLQTTSFKTPSIQE